MIHSSFSSLDWGIFALYFFILALSSYILSQTKATTSREYFLSTSRMPVIAVALSVLATSQSAATFLGVPEFAYKSDFTFIGFYISALFASLFIAYVLIPRFYAIKAMTVYELLETRYGERAKKDAGIMFLVGRILASGARLYIGALALSMILFLDITSWHVALCIALLLFGALLYTYFGGVRSVIFSDVIQAIIYVGAAIIVFIYLLHTLWDLDITTLLNEANKLTFATTSFDAKFNIFALLSGWLLLNIAAFGLDQDMTQRLLTCKDKHEAAKALFIANLLALPIVLLFLAIGALLYLFYAHQEVTQSFGSESITIFMYYILHEMPDGLRGIVTVGAIAAALSSTNSVLGAMASVAIEDLYRPFMQKRGKDEAHFLRASKIAVLLFALTLGAMAMVSYFWQNATGLSLVTFALGVMSFAYTGLLGVFFAAIFTSRGTQKLVPFALIGGFLSVLCMQPYIFGLNLNFAWQMVIGTLIAFSIMQLDSKKA
jgi:SSS family transporter